MASLTETLIPGIVALVFGTVFLMRRQQFIKMTEESHNRFWKDMVGMGSGVGKSGELFANIIVVTLGFAFLIAGSFLIYKFLHYCPVN